MDWETIIAIGVGAVVMIGSGIGNWMKQRAEREKAQQAADRRTHSAGSTDSENLQGVAARRREQLREMAMARHQQGRGDPSGTSRVEATSAGGQATNLSMAERIARARAEAQGDPRAARPQPSAPPTRPAVQSQAARDREHEQAQLQARRRAQQARQQEQQAADAHARREQQQRAHATAQRQQTPRQQQAAQRQQVAQLQAAAQRQRELDRMRVAESHDRIDAGESVVHRHVLDAETPPVPEGIGLEPVVLSKMDRSTWRRAMILKEVLDRPVALR